MPFNRFGRNNNLAAVKKTQAASPASDSIGKSTESRRDAIDAAS